jgi:hypothetical protein
MYLAVAALDDQALVAQLRHARLGEGEITC